jgi:hypothetical protein
MVRSPALRRIAAGAVAALAVLALPAAAQWKWRDASGHVQYSDLPPPLGTPDKDILNRPAVQQRSAAAAVASASAASASASGLVPRTVDSELETKRKKAEAEQAAKAKADEDKNAAIRADNCNRAKSQMQTLDSGIRLARTNDKGEREIMDDAQRDAETKRMRDIMSSNCK